MGKGRRGRGQCLVTGNFLSAMDNTGALTCPLLLDSLEDSVMLRHGTFES